MVRTGFSSALCLFLLLVLDAGRLPANPPANEDTAFQNSLALNRAMESAGHFMLAGENKKAVEVLEEQLPRVNGNTPFLRMLRKAYRGYIMDLWQTNNSTGAKRYLERLCILEPEALHDASLRPPETTPTIVAPEPKTGLSSLPAKFFPNFALHNQKKETNSPSATLAKPTTVRAKVENNVSEDDPFALTNKRPDSSNDEQRKQARQLIVQAGEEFTKRRFPEARVLYEKVNQLDKSCLEGSRDRWAYCMLNQVVDQLNQPNQNSSTLNDLQQKVRGALALAPNLEETCKGLLREIDQRSQTPGTISSGIVQFATVQHLGRNKEGWQVAETKYFRIFHNQSREQIEKVAAIAEKTRGDMYRKWFGSDGVEWSPKCELILHANSGDYSRMTGVPGTSPGHSRIESDPAGQRIISRRMDLRCDNPGMMEAVLPHETTHIVLAGMFGNRNVPRWADEGIAVLTEPSFKVDQHRRNLEKGQKEGMLFGVQELMQLDDYPQPSRIGAFYAKSVCLVEFLTELHGPQVLTAFVKDGLSQGYDTALQKHYGMDMTELQQRWRQRLDHGNRVATGP
jgi:hypothetical protein